MPEHIPYDLKPSQEYAVNKILDRFENNINPICALPIGGGKTAVTCTVIKKMISILDGRILIITKANNLKDPWMNELERFNIRYVLLHGKGRLERIFDGKYETPRNSVILTSHKTSAIDMEYFSKMGQFGLVIIDEIHSVINSNKMTQASASIAKINSQKKLFISATPIQNDRKELGLINILLNSSPDRLHDIHEFNEKAKGSFDTAYEEALRHEIIIQANADMDRGHRNVFWEKNQECFPAGFTAFTPTAKNAIQTSPIDNNANKYMPIRRSKIILSIPLYAETENFIMENKDYLKVNTRTNAIFSQRLEQFLSHPKSILKNNSKPTPRVRCGKLDAVDVILKHIPKNEKVVIFSRYKDVLYQYSLFLRRKGYEPITITGEDRVGTDRKTMLFKNSDTFNILLSTIFKSAEGINLPEANHVIILEFWWNPQRIYQAIGRIDRHNQERDIFAYILCYNKDGNLYDTESDVFEKMNTKTDEAKKVLCLQPWLPEIRPFSNELTFKDELDSFLSDFCKSIRNIDVSAVESVRKKSLRMRNREENIYYKTQRIKHEEALRNMPSNYDEKVDEALSRTVEREEPMKSIPSDDYTNISEDIYF